MAGGGQGVAKGGKEGKEGKEAVNSEVKKLLRAVGDLLTKQVRYCLVAIYYSLSNKLFISNLLIYPNPHSIFFLPLNLSLKIKTDIPIASLNTFRLSLLPLQSVRAARKSPSPKKGSGFPWSS